MLVINIWFQFTQKCGDEIAATQFFMVVELSENNNEMVHALCTFDLWSKISCFKCNNTFFNASIFAVSWTRSIAESGKKDSFSRIDFCIESTYILKQSTYSTCRSALVIAYKWSNSRRVNALIFFQLFHLQIVSNPTHLKIVPVYIIFIFKIRKFDFNFFNELVFEWFDYFVAAQFWLTLKLCLNVLKYEMNILHFQSGEKLL